MKTVRQLKAIKMPEVSFCAPYTMKDFAEYMSQATKDFDDPAVPLEKRGITPLIPCPGSGTMTTAWDVLTNVCESVGCTFEVVLGKVEIGG